MTVIERTGPAYKNWKISRVSAMNVEITREDNTQCQTQDWQAFLLCTQIYFLVANTVKFNATS